MWKKSRIRYKGIGKEADSVTKADERAEGNDFVKYLSEDSELFPHSRWRSRVSTMNSRAYRLDLLLYPAAAVLAHGLHLLMHLLRQLRYVRTYYKTYILYTHLKKGGGHE